jgi:predicted RNA-binding protein with PIN domain
LTEASQQRDTARDEITLLTGQLEEARGVAARLQAERDTTEVARGQAETDRDGAEMARRAADEERARLEEALKLLEGKVSSLVSDLGDTTTQLMEASQQRDTARDEITLLTGQLEEARREAARLQAAAGRGIARAAEAARLLSETLAEVALTGGEREVQEDRAGAREQSAGGSRRSAAELAWSDPFEEGERLAGGPRPADADLTFSEPLRDDERLAGGPRPADADLTLSEPLRDDERLAGGPRPADADLTLSEPWRDDERLAGGPRPEVGKLAWTEPLPEGDRLVEDRRPGHRGVRHGEDRLSEPRKEEDRLPGGPSEEEHLSGRNPTTEERQPGTPEVPDVPGERPRPTKPTRRPLPLPPAVFYDSFEAADHLVRMPGILLIVDGHNVTNLSSPDVELSRQRHQLVDGLTKLAKGTGPQVHLVFEQADLSGWLEPPERDRSQMRVSFSPAGVPSDRVIRDFIDQLHPAQAVVVASNNRELQEWVRRHGGNVVSVSQLLAVLRKASGSLARAGSLGGFRRRKG